MCIRDRPNIQSIAKALNVNPNWIIGKSEEMHVQTQIYPKIIDYYNQLNDFGDVYKRQVPDLL